jgi:sulfatase maturation enzyme AslB (radical SAM superfamily)
MAPNNLPASFCILPWLHLHFAERGTVFPCAFTREAGSPLADASGRSYDAGRPGDLEAAWNAPALKALRLSFLEGAQPRPCDRCFSLEKYHIQSLREVANRNWIAQAPALVEATAADGSLPFHIPSLDLRFGNHCNLRCRMCSPESSDKMLTEFQQLHPGIPREYFSGLEKLDWFRSPATKEVFLKHAANLKELHFAGGEPFLIPEIESFLGELVASGHAAHITLTFNSNLTLLPESFTRWWPSFERVKVFVSLDGVGPVNDYIRFPSKFAQIERNLHRLDEIVGSLPGSVACFNTTVQIYNIRHIPELVHFLTRSFRHTLPFPILSPLFWPEAFSIQALPASEKAAAAAALRELKENEFPSWKAIEARCDYPNGSRKFADSVDGIIQLMEAADRNHLQPEFQRLTDFFDQSRGQVFANL